MTDNRDWAAEIVMEILNQHGTDDDIHLDKLCEVLRKVDRAAELRGRVAGMKDAGEMIVTGYVRDFDVPWRENVRQFLFAAATKLESSPTT